MQVTHLFVISGLTENLKKIKKLKSNKVSLMVKCITYIYI